MAKKAGSNALKGAIQRVRQLPDKEVVYQAHEWNNFSDWPNYSDWDNWANVIEG